jgi:cysteine desulfurase/selenocysteine lyase
MYKNDFPILVKNPGITYLDSASSTQKPKYVIDKVSDYITSSYANIGRGSYLLAEKSDTYYFGAKEKVAKMIHCKANELFFSYNATYCINTIALSLATSGYLQEGGEIILSITEHHANILIWQQLATQYKLTIKWLDLHTDYTFNLPQLQELVSTKTLLVCLSLCSNVLGIKNDVRHVRQII